MRATLALNGLITLENNRILKFQAKHLNTSTKTRYHIFSEIYQSLIAVFLPPEHKKLDLILLV